MIFYHTYIFAIFGYIEWKTFLRDIYCRFWFKSFFGFFLFFVKIFIFVNSLISNFALNYICLIFSIIIFKNWNISIILTIKILLILLFSDKARFLLKYFSLYQWDIFTIVVFIIGIFFIRSIFVLILIIVVIFHSLKFKSKLL